MVLDTHFHLNLHTFTPLVPGCLHRGACTKSIQKRRTDAPKRRQPGSARLPTASFSIKSKNSSNRSGWISASTTIANGLEASAVDVDVVVEAPPVSNVDLMTWL